MLGLITITHLIEHPQPVVIKSNDERLRTIERMPTSGMMYRHSFHSMWQTSMNKFERNRDDVLCGENNLLYQLRQHLSARRSGGEYCKVGIFAIPASLRELNV